MIDAPLRQSIGGNISTPSKEHIIQVSGGEENQPINQGADPSGRHSTKRCSPEKNAINKDSSSLIESRPDKRSRPMEQVEAGSDCDTEVSSTVCARREWLKEFSKQHENNLPRKTSSQLLPPKMSVKPGAPSPATRTPPKAPRLSSSEAAASILVNRMMSDPSKRGFAPASYKPKMRPDEVQATNEGYASVAKLSEWLANDPTSTKKKKHVRRGKNIISKSRTFEKDMENVIVIETNMPRGAVQDRKKLIQGALRDDGKYRRISNLGSPGPKKMLPRYAMSETGAGDLSSQISVAQKKDWLKKAFKTVAEEMPKVDTEPARSEIIFNDAASSLSVSDKKDWLKNAFKKGTGESPGTHLGYNKAMTDVMHNRGGGDDAAARAKRRFLERSRNTPTKNTTHACQQVQHAEQPSPAVGQESKQEEQPVRESNDEERTGPPPATGSDVELAAAECTHDGNTDVEEDKTEVDFRTARQALIQRGKQNGHQMQVVNKVFMKKAKFEKLEMEQRRRSGIHGLLKTSWEEADPSAGLPSNAYDKKTIPNIAPKKSFEELP